jgi:hypothetical protein
MNWPEQKVVARLTAQYATKIRQAFKFAIDGDAIARSWAETHPAGGSVSPQTARDWALAHAVVNQKPLQYALSRIYADGYTLGVKVAKTRLTGLKKGVTANVVDWSTWKPGLPSAAALVKPMGGLKELLDSQKITIANEITRTKLDRIGTALATSLSRGDTARETAKAIDAIIADPQHALVIARTEMARAMSVASREQYQNAGVEQVEWLVAEGCADCQENADASPIPLGDEFPTGDTEPPAHPNCMCAIAPVFDDSALPAEGNVPEELSPEDFASASEDFATAAMAESMLVEEFAIPEAQYPVEYFTQEKYTEMLPKTPEGLPNFDAPFIGKLNGQATANIIKEQNLLSPVKMVDNNKFENLVSQGWTKIFRGYSAKSEAQLDSYIANFTHGENPYVTSGWHGNGTYFGSLKTATAYAEHDLGGVEISRGRVVEMALNPKAKILTEEQSKELQNAWVRANNEFSDTYVPNISDIAIAHGYDAIKIPNPEYLDGSQDYWVILNRGALVMKNG